MVLPIKRNIFNCERRLESSLPEKALLTAFLVGRYAWTEEILALTEKAAIDYFFWDCPSSSSDSPCHFPSGWG